MVVRGVTHQHNHGHALGLGLLVAAIAFAFGIRTAKILVGGVLLIVAAFFAYIMFRIVTGTI